MRFGLIAAALWPYAVIAQPVEQGPPNADFAPAFEAQTRAPALPQTPVTVERFVEGLANPWGIAPLPDGGWLVTERPGTLRVVSADGSVSMPLVGVPEVDNRRQGGLLDVTVSPEFATDRMVYLTYAKAVDGGVVTAAARGVLAEDMAALTDVSDIFVQTPPSSTPMHYGSRIIVDGDYVWITTGEHSSESDRVLAQDVTSTYGKVVRLFRDGSVPDDNPFVGTEADPAIWSLGHRNVQGAALGPDGALWTVEHGPAGGDELNRPAPGANYGWPVVSYGINYNGSEVGSGAARAPGFEEPIYYWDPVIAPGGMGFYDGDYAPWQGDLLIGSLNPGALVRLSFSDGLVAGEERVITDQGRIRDVEITPDGSVLLLIDAPMPYGGIVRVTPG
ncbi:PQQ-dependent sugar dehydrogenase [Flavimaricola marinus]|uniref:Soluble aldose sugar dehydrogenase YliI n=1 Tax=Flavimaricola marinus TaxID=1819565 RepID=A0A238LI29_9RHOB|nr:PQQ-dependent sugar dehydrogenase [Flavimaricola marinus]SMY09377.1 Soluble aldose sugar dehydrogenase YliI precursor [Flavimaricola marinus]